VPYNTKLNNKHGAINEEGSLHFIDEVLIIRRREDNNEITKMA